MAAKFKWVKDIKVLGWDLDGTLYPDNPSLSQFLSNKMIAEFAKRMGTSLALAEKEIAVRYKRFKSRTKVMDSLGIDGRRFYQDLWQKAPLERFLKPDDRLKRMFAALKGWRHFLLTNSGRKVTERKMAMLGIERKIFEKLLFTYESPYLKPEPEVFDWAVREMDCQPRRILYVGDREKTDILPAKKVGMRTCLVWGESQLADVSFDRVYDVVELFKQ